MKRLEDLRRKMDQIDEQLMKALEVRLAHSLLIQKEKMNLGLPLEDQQREMDIINKIESLKDPKFHEAIREIYLTILTAGKAAFKDEST